MRNTSLITNLLIIESHNMFLNYIVVFNFDSLWSKIIQLNNKQFYEILPQTVKFIVP